MRKHIIYTLAALLLVTASVPAFGFTLLSPVRTWATTPVPVRVYTAGNASVTDGDGGVTAVVNAVKAWNVVSSSSTNQQAVRGQAPATITLNNNGKICNGSCLAATLTGYYTGNTIYDADVYTTTRYPFFSSRESDGCSGEYDIDGVMVHEVGHVIGLGHSSVAGATMYPSVSACNTANRTLEADDIAGKNALY